MTYQLYYASGSAAMGVRVLLEEIGAPYELIQTTIDMDKPRPPEQLALNPNGWVPVLIWEEEGTQRSMYECAAITVFLCDRHAQAGLAPPVDGPTRGLFLQTLVYFSNSVQNAFQLDYYPDRFADIPADEASAQRRGLRRLRETWQVIDDQIGANRWVLGENFSAADIYLFMLTTWLAPERGQPTLSDFPNVERIALAVMERPSIQKVYEDWIASYEGGQS
ncbi:MAG: glutathione S-transferase family protein [Pseudomonadota bacterium]